jgi:hypothetical protein
MVSNLGTGYFLERLGGNLQFLLDLALGETAATKVQRRWNAEGAEHPPKLSHCKNKGWRHRSEKKSPDP